MRMEVGLIHMFISSYPLSLLKHTICQEPWLQKIGPRRWCSIQIQDGSWGPFIECEDNEFSII
jgi:hypothetical protein